MSMMNEECSPAGRDTTPTTDTLKKVIQFLLAISEETPVISLNEYSFKEYVQAPEKDYSFLVLFIGSMAERLDCQIYDQYLEISKPMTGCPEFKSKLFFGAVDIIKEPALFESVKTRYFRDTGKLISKEFPILMHYPPTGDLTILDYINFQDVEIKDVRNTILSLIEVRVVPSATKNTIIERVLERFKVLQDKKFWAFLSVAFCILHLAGEHWISANNHPLLYYIENEYTIIPRNKQQQTVLENIIVIIILSIFMSSMIQVIDTLKKAKKQAKKQKSNFLSDPKDSTGMYLCSTFLSFFALNFLFVYKTT